MIVIFFIPDRKNQSISDVQDTINSILAQSVAPGQIFAIGDVFNGADPSIQFLSTEKMSYTEAINQAVQQSDDPFILLIDNRTSPVRLNASAIDILTLTMKRNPGAAMIYADYDLKNDDGIQEIHLLHHHKGRVRDNQNYGRIFCIRTSLFLDCGGMDESIQYNPLYDLRLKLSEQGELVRIANKYSGSLYTIKAQKEAVNVFDYLMEEKDSQLEAEAIFTDHLKRI